MRFFRLFFLLLGLCFADPLRASEADRAQIAMQRMEIAARQEFLGQRIATAACFATLAIDRAAQLRRIGVSLAQFEDSLDQLEHGDPTKDLPPLRGAMSLASVHETRLAWSRLHAAAEAIRNEASDQAALDRLLAAETSLAGASRSLIAVFETDLSDPDPARTRQIGAIGAQRRRGQAIVLAICRQQIAPSPDAPTLITTLTTSFEGTTFALIRGDKNLGLSPPRDTKARDALLETHYAWSDLRFLLAPAREGRVLQSIDLYDIAQGYEALLDRLDIVMAHYLEA